MSKQVPGGHSFVWKISKKVRSRARPVRGQNFIRRWCGASVVGGNGPRGLGGIGGGIGRGEKSASRRKMLSQPGRGLPRAVPGLVPPSGAAPSTPARLPALPLVRRPPRLQATPGMPGAAPPPSGRPLRVRAHPQPTLSPSSSFHACPAPVPRRASGRRPLVSSYYLAIY